MDNFYDGVFKACSFIYNSFLICMEKSNHYSDFIIQYLLNRDQDIHQIHLFSSMKESHKGFLTCECVNDDRMIILRELSC